MGEVGNVFMSCSFSLVIGHHHGYGILNRSTMKALLRPLLAVGFHYPIDKGKENILFLHQVFIEVAKRLAKLLRHLNQFGMFGC